MTTSKWVAGENDCKTFADGTVQKPSYVCYFFVFLILVTTVGHLAQVQEYPVYALTHTVIGTGLVYVMYENCVKCNGWRGFLLTAAIGIVVGIVVQALPIAKPPIAMRGPREKPCPGGKCDQHGLPNATCVGGGCDKEESTHRSCAGGKCTT